MPERPWRILLIEDSPADALLVAEALRPQAAAYDVVRIADGAAALEYVDRLHRGEAACPDLVMLDLNLPKHSGTEVLERLRAEPGCRDIPVIIFTTSDAAPDRAAASQLGAASFFRKPSDLDEFLKIGEIVSGVLNAGRPPL